MSRLDFPKRLALVYAGLMVICLCAIFGAYKGATAPQSVSVKKVKKIVSASVGDQSLVSIAEAQVTDAAQQQGVNVLGFKLVKVSHKGPYEATVRLKVKTDKLGQVTLDVKLSKSTWQLGGISPA